MAPETPDVPQWIVYASVIGVFGGLIGAAALLHERRRRLLDRMAGELGLTFYEHGGHGADLPGYFHRYSEGAFPRDTTIRRSIQGELGGLDVLVAEFLQYTGSSASTRKRYGYPQTVGLFRAPELDLPRFLLRPETLRHKVIAPFKGNDIDFLESARFSRTYLLCGEDEPAVRALFSERVRAFFEKHPGRIAQGFANELIYYRPARLHEWVSFRPKTIRSLLKEAHELVGLVKN
ncbi:MAG: hypothetical protein JXR94_06770 [Candidatus Hydrogenedentes bacterium]|nr:hypothetical protein [Candidatus Hydrogenedentota bacterium]